MKIAITGHRPHKLWNDYDLVSPGIQRIRQILQGYIDQLKPTTMISGMALGIDTLWAELALKNHIPLIAAVPCQDQQLRWPLKSQTRYISILKEATAVVFVHNGPYNGSCMQLRNQWMVDNCDLLIAVWDGTTGGTANCVSYATQVGKRTIIIHPVN
jgi:uncharacterized phage-like protein YoqJ